MTKQTTDVGAAMANYASRVRGCLLGGAIGMPWVPLSSFGISIGSAVNVAMLE